MIASFLPTGAVAALTNSQLLYNLPISLFGMSVAAAELPELSEAADRPDARTDALRGRLAAGSAQVAFFIVPTVLAFVALGHLIAGLIFQSGAFTQQDSYWVWGTLAGASVGLLPQSLGRLLTSAYFALNDTRTPLRCATIRVSIALALGLSAALLGPRLLGVDAKWGTVGLALGTGIAGSVEYGLLRRYLKRRIGSWPTAEGRWPKLVGSAALATGAGLAASLPLGAASPVLSGGAAVSAFGLVYLASTWALAVPEARALSARFRRRDGR
jgi:putative peptidoglycan lipid II flippase